MLQPVVVDGALFDVVLVATVLEEKLLVTPLGSDVLRARHDPSDQVIFATELRRLVVGEHLEHRGVGFDLFELVIEVVLVSISPAIDIIRLEVDHEWPVRLCDLITMLIVLCELHDGSATNVVGSVGAELTVGHSKALVLGFSQDIGVSVLEEVVAGLAIVSESGDEVAGGHTVTEELDRGAGASLGHFWGGLGELRNSQDGVLGALEDTSVGGVVSGDELSFGNAALGFNSLDGIVWSGVRDSVKVHVEVLVEEFLEIFSNEESFILARDLDLVPDVLLFASSRHGLVFRGIEVLCLAKVGASALGIHIFSGGDTAGNKCQCNLEFHLNLIYKF